MKIKSPTPHNPTENFRFAPFDFSFYAAGSFVEEKSAMTEEEKQLRREQCLSRHDSIRTQANIQLLDERINLIGSLKAHREHCQ